MKISKIEPQKRNKSRCSIYIDGEFKFGLTKALVLKHGLQEGNEINEDEITNILLNEEKEKIRNRAFRILQYRERSVLELRRRLITIGFDPSLVEEIIEDLVNDDTLNDERFARAFVNDYTRLKPKGNRFVYNELIKRGISRDLANELLSKRDEKGLIRNFVRKKIKNFNIGSYKERQKIIRRLLNHGFTTSTVYEVLDEKTRPLSSQEDR